MRSVFLSVALVVVSVCGAQAATIEIASGSLAVNSGGGFKAVGSGTEVNPGSSVMASPGSSGDIVYSNGCRVHLEAGSVVVVAAEPPVCSASAGAGGGDFPLVAGALVVGGAAAAIAIVASDDDSPASGQ